MTNENPVRKTSPRRLALLAVCFGIGAVEPLCANELLEQGRDRYLNDCGGCHGADARGDGAVAAALKIPPSDLTQLTRGNAGEFPEAYVRRVVDGRELPPAAHGETSMPVWGKHYRRALPGYSEAIVTEKIDALVAYLKSIQAE